MVHSFNKILFYLSLSLCVGQSCYAYTYYGPIASSLGGAGVAMRDPVEAGFLNPASVALVSKSYLSLATSNWELEGQKKQRDFSLIVLDGTDESISKGSLAFRKRELRSPGLAVTESHWSLNVGKFVVPGLAYGIGLTKQTTKYLHNSTDFVDYNLNAGFLLNWSKRLSFGGAAYNLFTGKEARQSRAYALGARTEIPLVNLYADLRYQEENVSNNRRLSFMGGFEFVAKKEWVWRLGYASLGPEADARYGIGLQWLGPRLGFNYAYQVSQNNSAQKAHSIDLRMFF